ncbi:hypothetical protein PS1M3_16250 [Pseudoalteromonas sp. PS1M3]|mgnify:CR=1 FL=1|jgi:hypothetical protein|uniref:hypothetical protein n=1 Tax=Pseudoalteromonas TaxID=53246 RepID=UPI0000EAC65E|nr:MULTISPECIES: hypothetical protein [Pseudoalteromonas]EAW27738.1 hypothetical protein ATW7_13043 [Alteromonadales bacterium TW-7]MBL1386801.1 hypothetical protein [Colwellia sp.]MCK8122470.1 hypothetical protein [Pseudoalteromonas sp. 2CM32C]BBW91538.1 hypothetical protein PS1M3_16250 [Pseudoalteromonas sp. PS1M3]
MKLFRIKNASYITKKNISSTFMLFIASVIPVTFVIQRELFIGSMLMIIVVGVYLSLLTGKGLFKSKNKSTGL